jgi:hypothetical protein
MEWGRFVEGEFEFDIPEWQRTSSPEGKLDASKVELEPKTSLATSKSIELEASSVSDFQIITKEADGKTSKQTKAKKTELHFKVTLTDNNACRKLEQYYLTVTEGTMTIVYTKKPEQGTLPGVEGTDEKQGKLEGMVSDIAKKRAADKD